jgi:glycosyltransferase involved in cell wall biosynthesis
MNDLAIHNRNRISLCMIVKNEEKFLEGCLKSVQGVVDEIILVDTGSTDRTLEIAKAFDAKQFSFPWIHDFSAARNESLSHATCEWILYLDADERLKSGEGKKLRQLISRSNVNAYNVWIEGSANLRDGAVAQRNAYPRIFRSHPSVRFEGRVHEQIAPSLERMGWNIHPSDLVIEHLGYGQGFRTVVEKAQRNRKILKKQIEEEPENAYARFQFGNTLSVLGECDDAYRELEQALASTNLSHSISASAFSLLSEMDIRRGQFDRACEHAHQSLAKASNQKMARWVLVVAHIGSKEYSHALSVLHELMEQKSKWAHGIVPAFDVNVELWKLLFQQGICYEGLQQYDKAVEAFLAALNAAPELDTVLPPLSRLLLQVASRPQWMESLNAVLQKYPSHLEVMLLMAEQLWRQQHTQQALDLLQKCQAEYVRDLRAYSKEIEWALVTKDYARVNATLQRAEASNVLSYFLFKIAIEGSLHESNIVNTLSYLEWMIKSVPEQIPEQVLPKMKALTARLDQVSKI